mgnify:CR=1 FL=1|jgi:hypothetical protein
MANMREQREQIRKEGKKGGCGCGKGKGKGK